MNCVAEPAVQEPVFPRHLISPARGPAGLVEEMVRQDLPFNLLSGYMDLFLLFDRISRNQILCIDVLTRAVMSPFVLITFSC